MNALDQAFIKAYKQQGTPSGAAPLDAGRTVPLAEALADRPRQKPAQAPAGASVDEVLAALAAPAKKQAERPPFLCVASAAAREKEYSEASDPGEQEACPPAPTLADFGLADVVYRLDKATVPPVPAAPDHRAIPPPHLDRAGAEATRLAAGTTADAGVYPPGGKQAAVETPARTFRPMLQVDRFVWPPVCNRLIAAAGAELDRLSDAILAARDQGKRVLAIAGCRRGEGGTTLLLCVARRLTERGLRIAMADADLADPQLAPRLGLQSHCGWESVWARQLPLSEVVVEASDTRLALLPLREPLGVSGGSVYEQSAVAEGLDTLAANYDLVLVDPGPLEDFVGAVGMPAGGIARRLDAVVLVQDVRVTGPERLAEMQRRLAAAGIARVGIVQNLVHR
jgi:Mrp family chromosome partitioning ATPase